MLPFYKIGIIFYIIFSINGKATSYCNRTFNFMQCGYDVYCNNYQSSNDYNNNLNYYRFNDNNDNNYQDENIDDDEGVGVHYTRSCNSIYHNNYGPLYPVHLTIKNDLFLLKIPRYKLNDIITKLDFSNNNYELIPEISEMPNLVLLNVSKNQLTVAELSNTIDLPKLTEIDLSHNIISGIRYQFNTYRFLKKIDLSYNYLTKIPEAIFDPFNELEALDISHNYIEILSSFTFEGMKQLQYLNISFNRIRDIDSSLFRFIKLKVLEFSKNNIAAIKVTDFSKLTNLVTLDLNSNFVSSIEKDAFNNTPVLQNLYLNNNKLEDVDKKVFSNLTGLREIDLSDNVFKKLPKNLFKGKHIIGFSITGNQLEGSLEKDMLEGLVVNELDLSNQHLDSVKDFAFNGVDGLQKLLLNNNDIRVLTAKAFKTLQHLKHLDLSFNKIQSIEFEKDDLFNLLSLSLRNNYLTVVKQENFHGLNSLQFLDLSDNKITQVESNSFVSLKELINFQISNNPLSGTLEEKTFDGLSSLPSLDISCTLLSSIQNGSFLGMVQLKNLNVSHSKINILEYNVFIHTGAIEIIDLSFNELKDFKINSTELASLNTLYLNNNLIKILDPSTFKNILSLSDLSLSHNMIQNINTDIFVNQKYLRLLDLSYNSNINLTISLLNATKTLDILDLSGIKTVISFGNLKDISLTQLAITNSSVTDVKKMQLNELRHLDDLNLSYNAISKLEVGSFNHINALRFLDLSHNKIKIIQPGIFQDNTMLVSLNVSHNYLTAVSYGIFHGLIYLRTLDISYNHIIDLQNERFYEVRSLSALIADHNKIESIAAEDFVGTSLTKLSIGGNPIPCEVLVNLKRNNVPFEITASKLYENNDENVHGITCNKKLHMFDQIKNGSSHNVADNVKVLLDIRDILLDLKHEQTSKPTTNFDEKYLANISDQIKSSNAEISNKISIILNSTADVIAVNNETNIELNKIQATIANNETVVLLSKILRTLTLNLAPRAPQVRVTKDNATYENLLSYINKVKQDLEDTFKMDKDSILNEVETKMEAKMEAKISAVNSHVNQNNIIPSETPKHEKLSASGDSKTLFTETCVALILVILVVFVLFKVYKSGMFVRQRLSVSTRELQGSMDSPL